MPGAGGSKSKNKLSLIHVFIFVAENYRERAIRSQLINIKYITLGQNSVGEVEWRYEFKEIKRNDGGYETTVVFRFNWTDSKSDVTILF